MFYSLHFQTLRDHYHATIRNMFQHTSAEVFLTGKALAGATMVSGLFLLIIFYTRYIRVYLLEYMLRKIYSLLIG